MAARGFLGAGDLYIARYNPTTAQFEAFKGPYEATKFEIKPNVELKELSSRGRSTYGQVIESVALAQPADFTVDLPEVNKESLAIALLGSASVLTQGSGSRTNLAVTAKLGGWIDLGDRNITPGAGFVVTNVAGSTTYVVGVDYQVNYRLGMLYTIPGGAITDNLALHVDYAYSAVSGSRIAGGTNTQVRARFRLDGVNFADNLPCIVNAHEGIIAADSAFDFLQNDFASVSLPGRLKTPVGYTEPFTVDLLDAAI